MTVRRLALTIIIGTLAFPALASAQPTMSWGRAVHDAHIIVGKWMNGQSTNWSNLAGIQATGKDCYRGNLRTFYCTISFTGTYTSPSTGISQDAQVYAVARMYLLSDGRDLYSQVGSLWAVTTSAPYFTGNVARKHDPVRWHGRCPVKRCDVLVSRASAAVAGKVSR